MVLILIGVSIICVTFADFIQTTLGADRGGRISRWVSRGLWRLAKVTPRLFGTAAYRYSGPFVLTTLASLWVAAHWIGWMLVFAGFDGSVVLKETGEPARLGQIASFIGAALSTLGASLAEPSSAFWDFLSTIAAMNGLVVLTLAVTFVLNVTQTVTAGRAFALLHGPAAGEASFSDGRRQLAGVAAQLSSFPLALYFSSPQPQWRTVPAIVQFIETAAEQDRLRELGPILETLAGLDATADDDDFREKLHTWSRRNTLG